MTDWFDEPAAPRERPALFAWLALLAVAATRRRITAQQAGVALLVANTSTGASGEGAVVDAERLAIETGLSERQIWRHFKALVDGGWFKQTALPHRGARGERGTRARYRLTLPALDLSLVTTSERVTSTGGAMSHDRAETLETCDTFAPERLTLSAETCDIAGRENGTVLPSYGLPSNGLSTSPPIESRPQNAREAQALTTDADPAGPNAGHLASVAESQRRAREGVRRAVAP